jgi:phage head maturation protease
MKLKGFGWMRREEPAAPAPEGHRLSKNVKRETTDFGEIVIDRAPLKHRAYCRADFKKGEDGLTELTFSSEMPVMRWGEPEILSHDKEDCDFTRLAEVGAVLKNHDPDQIVGTPVKVWLGDDRRGHLKMRFGSTDTARNAEQEVEDGSLRGVSVGYKVNAWMHFQEKGAYRGKTYDAGTWLASSWEALEASLTPIPADASVGVGRGEQNQGRRPQKAGGEKAMRIKLSRIWFDADMVRHEIGEIVEVDEVTGKRLLEKKHAEEAKDDAGAGDGGQRAEPPAAPAPQATAANVVPREAVEQALRAERERCTAIRNMGKKNKIDVTEAIEQGWSVDQAREYVLGTLEQRQAERPTSEIEVTQDGRASFRRAVVVGLQLRSGRQVDEKERKEVGGENFAGMTLREIARDCLRRAGIAAPADVREMVQTALRGPTIVNFARAGEAITVGTSDFPYILANVAHKEMLAGASAEIVTYREWCKIGSGSDFKAMSRLKLSEAGELDLVPEFGEYAHTKFAEQREQITIATYGKAFNLSRQAIINDDIQAFTDIPNAMGRAAARKPNVLAVKVLLANAAMSDGTALFASGHNNLNEETDYRLDTVDHARAGIGNLAVKLMKQSAFKHSDLSAEEDTPTMSLRMAVLLTPATGHLNALAAVGATTFGSGIEGVNPLRNIARVVPEPQIENTNITGYSTTAYFGFADPRVSPVIEVAFLNGNTEPYMEEVENVGTAADGRVFKVRLDCVAGAVDWRGAVKETGVDA